MRPSRLLLIASAAAVLAACATAPASGPMSFFVTSAGPGNGADLGGLAGADAHCQKLAAAAGAGNREWRAYLSVPAVLGQAPVPAVAARDRIGTGPWFNAKGARIAADVNDLHGPKNNLTKATALDERGNGVKGAGDQPNEHDILTGSRDDGTAFSPRGDTTCKAWTSSGEGMAIVGHHDRRGLTPEAWSTAWNFSHPTAGCSQQALVSTGGSGRFYCFAAK
jgi:hypothetical protein